MSDLFAPDLFRHCVQMTVRFGEVDVMAHVNNATYLTYLEQARMHYALDVLGWDGDLNTLGLILARATLDYKTPLRFNERFEIWTRCMRLGAKSFDLACLLRRLDGGDQPGPVVATAVTSLVAYDYATQTTIAVPDHWRARMLAYEPALTT